MIDSGALPDLIRLVDSPNDGVREQATWALGNIAGDSGESIDAEQRVASAAGKMTTAVAAETIAANGNDNGEGGSDISGKGHAVPVGVQNDARESAGIIQSPPAWG